MIGKRTILIMAIITLLFFGGIGAIFAPMVRETTLNGLLLDSKAIWMQVSAGILFGYITAMAGWQIVRLPLLKNTRLFFADLIRPLQLTTIEIFFISVCAGLGEEMFFRGLVQPALGIWTTSILFVLLHGYINPFNIPLTIYGIYMVLVIGVMGQFTEQLGITTAIIAHIVIDFVLLRQLSEAEPPEDKITEV